MYPSTRLHEFVSGSAPTLCGEVVELLFRLRGEVHFQPFKIRENRPWRLCPAARWGCVKSKKEPVLKQLNCRPATRCLNQAYSFCQNKKARLKKLGWPRARLSPRKLPRASERKFVDALRVASTAGKREASGNGTDTIDH
jgi:hypothetical protein